MLVPDLLRVKEWPTYVLFNKPDTPRMAYSCCRYLEIRVAGNHDAGGWS